MEREREGQKRGEGAWGASEGDIYRERKREGGFNRRERESGEERERESE